MGQEADQARDKQTRGLNVSNAAVADGYGVERQAAERDGANSADRWLDESGPQSSTEHLLDLRRLGLQSARRSVSPVHFQVHANAGAA